MVFSNEFIANVILPAACLLLLLLALILAHKMDRLKQAQLINARLKKSLDEMDEQAKLIVRTDMELNKTQEELDTVLKIFESIMPVEWSKEEKMSFLFPDKPSDLG